AAQQKKILQKFGFTIKGSSVIVPFWRPDVTIWQDLAEEVGRFKGLDQILAKFVPLPTSASMSDPMIEVREKAEVVLMGLGFDELYTYAFVSESDLKKWHIDKKIVVEIENPISVDQQYLRPNLSINIL